MCQVLELTDKRNALSRTLSGGMKRKLSVGIALSAGSKVCLSILCVWKISFTIYTSLIIYKFSILIYLYHSLLFLISVYCT